MFSGEENVFGTTAVILSQLDPVFQLPHPLRGEGMSLLFPLVPPTAR